MGSGGKTQVHPDLKRFIRSESFGRGEQKEVLYSMPVS